MIKLEIITITDSKYPSILREIKNPPKKLYTLGNIELLKTPIISIIGSRACSENGIKLASKFAKELSYQGITIASGMAEGIDTIAHKATLEEKGNTIAVLGNGFNHIFPPKNEGLFKQILKKSGLIITEYPANVKAKSEYFLERNRIVSGIALGVLVVEAAHRSGTSVTAKLATEQGKKVFALPHELGNIHGVGTNRLIKNGAKIITKTSDIMEEFPFLPYKEQQIKPEKTKRRTKKVIKNKEQNVIYKYINEKPISVNELYQKTHKNIQEINSILFMLELNGYIKKVAGGYICILEKK